MTFLRYVTTILSGLVLAIGLAGSALADDWKATKLRGAVFALVDNNWQQLTRGDIVPDDRVIRTAPNGRVQFRRDNETIDLAPDTQIRIFDRVGQKYTVVQQHFGEVAVEVERKQVQHFVVQTEYLAAVVKGTRFTVTANDAGADVSVQRGVVEVRDTGRKLKVDITPGQSASVGNAEKLNVSGTGTLPTVVGYTGDALAEDVAAVAADEDLAASDVGTPAVANTADTPAASVVANTPAATKTVTTVTDASDVGTPAVANTADTPAASVVANTPAATKTPPGQTKTPPGQAKK